MLGLATSADADHVLHAARRDVNLWQLSVGDAAPRAVADVQLDTCGAWVTIRHQGARPVLARRAGWVDLRGHPAASGEELDRVGLGPGDAIVLLDAPPGVEADVMAALLEHLGADERRLAQVAADAAAGAAVAVAVPDATKLTAAALAAATGRPAEAFSEPLHPVGSAIAEMWSRRPAPPRQARMRLAPRRDAVPAARQLLRRLMASWRMDELLEGSLDLLATEIVTNAVVHARTRLDVTVTYTGDAVRFDVYDRDGTLPVPSPPDLYAEGGRGLWMMTTLASHYGIEPASGGKRIWFSVDA